MPPVRLAVVMDPIESIKPEKDSTFAMLLEAQARDWSISYLQVADLTLFDAKPYAYTRHLSVQDDAISWFTLGEEKLCALADFDVILMRKDPPFTTQYVYATQLLELAEQHGTLVLNRPASLRDYNEKLATALFPQCCPPHIVTSRHNDIVRFLQQQQDIVLKPLGGMGGESIFRLQEGDVNTNVIIETMTQHGKQQIMAQQYLPAITAGDKRILLIDGEPVPYALARIPKAGELRGNLAKGASSKGVELSARDLWICEQVAPMLQQQGLLFVGLDVIGDYLTEINVTSPTCIRELDKLYRLNISAIFLNAIEAKLDAATT